VLMSTDPSQVELSLQQRRILAELADQAGKPWSDVLSEALGQYRLKCATNSVGAQPKVVFGSGKGLITLADDFAAALDDFRDYVE
jgi:hypothetical protein